MCLRLFPRFAAAAFAVAMTVASLPAVAQDVLVFAAASQREALEEIANLFERSVGGSVAISYAASSVLARQIEQGAPADVFISAHPTWMDYLQERDLIYVGRRMDLVGNELVLVAAAESEVVIDIGPGFPLAQALGGGRLAMGDPDHVPAGVYGKAALESLGVWRDVEQHLAPAESVRAALALVSRGEAPLGIVYASDAAADAGVRVVGRFPIGSHAPIVYPAAMTKQGRSPSGLDFFNFLWSEASMRIFRSHGFAELQ